MSIQFKEEVPFLRLLIGFIIGICISIQFNLLPSPIYTYSFGILFVILLVLNLAYKKSLIYKRNFVAGSIIHIMVCLAAIIITNQRKEIYFLNHFSNVKGNQIIVHLAEDPKIKGDIARFLVRVEAVVQNQKIQKTRGNLLVAVWLDNLSNFNFHYGDQLLILSKFSEIEPPYNPSEFNYKRFLEFRQVYHQTFIKQAEAFKIDNNKGNFIKAFALKFREKQVEKFRKYIPNSDAQAVASTLILGYRTDLSQDILQAYSKTGTMHILSVSGMHVAIVVILLEFLLGFMNRKRWTKLLKAILMIVFVWFYSIITGLAPSVERAALMITLFIIGKILLHRGNTFNIISISAFIILFFDPFALMDIGFQLSYIAVSGLVYLQPKIQKLFVAENKLVEIIWSCISVSIAAQLATSAISLYYFHQFPLCFIISNVFIILPATLIMYGGIAFLLIPWPSFMMDYFGSMLNQLIIFTNKSLFFIEQIPGSNLNHIYLNIFEIVLFYLILGLILTAFKMRDFVWIKWALTFSLIFIFSITFKNFEHTQQQQTMFFSLRKNSATALIKGKTVILISDLDSAESAFRFSVKPYLDSCRIKHITYINPYKNKNNSIFTFQNKKLLIQQNSFINDSLKTDFVVLNANQIFSLNEIQTLSPTYLFIGGGNKDYIIKNYEKQAAKLQIPYHILKRKPAVELKF
jgi:competence protein ComEC